MIRHAQSHLLIEARSHPGRSGKKNEDRYAVSAYRVSMDDPVPSLLAVVSDGIGGHRAGEVAAEMAVNVVSHAIASSSARHPLETMQEAVRLASEAISERARSEPSMQGMGATCACTWVIGERLYTASIGDSRIYLLRGGIFQRLTTDHTWVQEAMEKGFITPEQARNHPNIHVIRRYLGSIQPPAVDVRMRLQGDESDTQARSNQGMRLMPGDVILLCTDGLTDLVTDEEMHAAVKGRNLQMEAQRLIDLANDRGGHDNVTVILIAVPSKKGRTHKRSTWPWIVACIAGIILIAVVWLALTWKFPPPGVRATQTATLEATPFYFTKQATTPVNPTSSADLTTAPTPGTSASTYTPWPTNTP